MSLEQLDVDEVLTANPSFEIFVAHHVKQSDWHDLGNTSLDALALGFTFFHSFVDRTLDVSFSFLEQDLFIVPVFLEFDHSLVTKSEGVGVEVLIFVFLELLLAGV
jgi:hypothetical protein